MTTEIVTDIFMLCGAMLVIVFGGLSGGGTPRSKLLALTGLALWVSATVFNLWLRYFAS
jgi:hypothetical protein